MSKWSAFKKEEKKVTLPSAGVEVTLKEPDIVSLMLTGEVTLSDSLFSMFAKSTEEGKKNNPLSALGDDPEAGQGLIDFLDMLMIASFSVPKVVRHESEADYKTTIPVSAINILDKMFVMEQFQEMFSQLNGLNSFRPQANGNVSPTSEG